MSKPSSGHFSGTTGSALAKFSQDEPKAYVNKTNSASSLDFREHPVKNYSSTSINKIRSKVNSRTATKNEYRKLEQNRRLANRRKKGVREFWRQERERLNNNKKGTRNWSASQMNDIRAGRIPKFNSQPLQGHHTYTVKKYPHLANKGQLIYPVTFYEHLYGCHGGNFKNDLPDNTYKSIRKDF